MHISPTFGTRGPGRRRYRILLLACVLGPLLSTGCRARQNAMPAPLPPDLKVEATAGSLVPGEENRIVEIAPDGIGRFVRYLPSEPGPPLEEAAFTLTERQMAALWAAVGQHGFFGLDSLYADPDVDDGAIAMLTVTAQGRTHRVEVRNVAVPGFEALLEAVDRATPPGMDLDYPAPDG